MKICIITNIPSPYRLSLFEKLDREFHLKGWNLTVVFLTKTYQRRKWDIDENQFNFHYRFLESRLFNFGESFFSFGLNILRILYQEKPDIILLGGFSFPMMLALLFAKIHTIPYCLWSGETIEQSNIRKDIFNLRKMIRRWIILNASAAAVYGNASKQYMIEMGMAADHIFIAINTVDTDFYRKHSAEYRLKKEDFKKDYQYPDINLLYVGHLTEQKGLQYLFKAIHLIKDFDNRAALHIVGSGPYVSHLKSLQQKLFLKKIYFHGFKQKNELPFFYGICDVFVFPSLYDIWGLVCIEAMASGLPVICSVHCGISHDLVHEENAILVSPKDTNGLTQAIHHLIRSNDYRISIAKKAHDLINTKINLSESIKGFISMLYNLYKS